MLVLHTWTRELGFHPHLHLLATAGGLALDGTGIVPSGKKYLFPVHMMGKVFRAKMLYALGALQKKGAFPGLPEEFYATRMAAVSAMPWVVYAKKSFRHSSHVVAWPATPTGSASPTPGSRRPPRTGSRSPPSRAGPSRSIQSNSFTA
jgi:hypothetical protein